jgi:hypothetical protein
MYTPNLSMFISTVIVRAPTKIFEKETASFMVLDLVAEFVTCNPIFCNATQMLYLLLHVVHFTGQFFVKLFW